MDDCTRRLTLEELDRIDHRQFAFAAKKISILATDPLASEAVNKLAARLLQ